MFLLQLIRFSGVALGEACTIVIRGATQQILDEAERSIHDALCVLSRMIKDTKVVYGGGKRKEGEDANGASLAAPLLYVLYVLPYFQGAKLCSFN